MKPFTFKNINRMQRIFNYRLSRARRVVENAFGILSSRFRVLRRPLHLDLENVDAVVLACCALHNFLRTYSVDIFPSPFTLIHKFVLYVFSDTSVSDLSEFPSLPSNDSVYYPRDSETSSLEQCKPCSRDSSLGLTPCFVQCHHHVIFVVFCLPPQ